MRHSTPQENPQQTFLSKASDWFYWASCSLLRWKFGYRFASLRRLLPVALILYYSYTLSGTPFLMFRFPRVDDMVIVHFWVLLALGMAHFVHAEIRARRRVRWHGYSNGESFLYKPAQRLPLLNRLSYPQFRQYVEPLLVFLPAIALPFVSEGYRTFLTISAIAMFLKERDRNKRFRNNVQDMIDAEIESEEISNAVKGDGEDRSSYGFSVEMDQSEKDNYAKYEEFESKTENQ